MYAFTFVLVPRSRIKESNFTENYSSFLCCLVMSSIKLFVLMRTGNKDQSFLYNIHFLCNVEGKAAHEQFHY